MIRRPVRCARAPTLLVLAALSLAAPAKASGLDAGGRPRAAFLGSSTTAGTGASRPERRWSAIVARDLGWSEVNLGLRGSKLVSLGDRIPAGEGRAAEVLNEAPDVVVVMYGANDVVAGVALGGPDASATYHHAVRGLLQRLRAALPAALLFVCSPQPAEALRGIRAPYDAVLAREAAAVGAVFVPAGEAFPLEQLPRLAADRIHLNDRGHAALARFVRDRIAAALRDPEADPGSVAGAGP